MKLTIIAATGGVGRQLLEQALDAGHDVTAVVRSPAKLTRRVTAVVTDLKAPDPAALEAAIRGADAVVSGLGMHSNTDTAVAASGTGAVVDAMRSAGVRRIVAVSAAPVSTMASPSRPHPPRHDPGDGLVMRYLLNPFARAMLGRVFMDLVEMEDVLVASQLDWTIVRPPQLTDKPATGRYRTVVGQNIRGGLSIPRADVAHYMLAVIGDAATIHQAIGIAR